MAKYYGFYKPSGTDMLRDGDNVITANMNIVEGELNTLYDSLWDRGTVPAGTDLDTLRTPGVYRVSTYSLAQSLINAPVPMNTGTIEVLPISATDVMQRITNTQALAGSQQYQRTSASGTFSRPWENTALVAMPIPSNSDLNDYVTPGIYDVSLGSVARTIKNLDESSPVLVTVYKSQNISNWTAWQTVRVAGGEGKIKTRSITSAGVVEPWRVIYPAEGGESASIAGPSPARAAARTRRLGGYGTSGKPVVVLTFDHGLSNLTQMLADHADDLGVPYTVAVSTDEVNTGENAGVTWANLQTLALNSGVEMSNHSPGHADQPTNGAIHAAVVDSKAKMLTNMPALAVDSFIMPGHGVEDGWGGLGGARTFEAVNNTYAGQLIQNTHGVFTGAVPGDTWPTTGDLPAGVTRTPMDLTSWISYVQNQITAAIARGSGETILALSHPVYWDTESRPTASRIRDFITWCADRRAAGEIVLATVTGAAFARAYDSHVPRLDNPAGWDNGTQTITVPANTGGGVFQVEAPGATAITVTDDTGALSSTVQGEYRPFTIPAASSTITVAVTGGSSPIVRPV